MNIFSNLTLQTRHRHRKWIFQVVRWRIFSFVIQLIEVILVFFNRQLQSFDMFMTFINFIVAYFQLGIEFICTKYWFVVLGFNIRKFFCEMLINIGKIIDFLS